MRANPFRSLMRRVAVHRKHPGTTGRPIPTGAGTGAEAFAGIPIRMARHAALCLLLLASALIAWCAWPLLKTQTSPAPLPSRQPGRVMLPAIVPEAPSGATLAAAASPSAEQPAPLLAAVPEPVSSTLPAPATPRARLPNARPTAAPVGSGRPPREPPENRPRPGLPAAPRAPGASSSQARAAGGAALANYTLNTVYPGQAWIQSGQRIVVVRTGDRLGDVVVERIDPVARCVITSGGVIR